MGDEAQGVHLVAVQQQVHLHKLAGAVVGQLVVQGGIALGVGLQGVEEVINDLVQGHLVVHLHQVGVQILHVLELAPAGLAQRHDVAHVLVGGDDGDLDVGLLRALDGGGVRVVVGIVHPHQAAVGLVDVVDDRGQSSYQFQVELPLQPLLDDLHVEHAQKAAPKAKAQSHGGLRLEAEGRVVQPQLLQGVPQVRVLGAVLGVNAAVDHGLHGTVARQGLRRGGGGVRDGVAHPGVLDVLNGSGEVAHLSGLQAVAGLKAQGQQVAALHHLVGGAGGHQLHLLAGADAALHQPHVHDDAPVAVVLAVEDQGFQGRVHVAGGGGHVLDDVLQHGVDVDAHLGGDLRRVHSGQADDVLHLVLGLPHIGGGQVDLVEHRQDLQVVLHGEVGVGQGLGLHALGGVHHQHRALAGRQGPGHLVVEVHMARGVDEVQLIDLSVLGPVVQPDGPGLDGDAPLPLQVHVVQQLAFHLPLADRLALLQQPVRQRGLAVVDVGDDRKVSDVALFRHIWNNLHRQVHAGPRTVGRREAPLFQIKNRGPRKLPAVFGERRNSAVSELLPTGRSERYGACDDAVDVGNDGKVPDIRLLCRKVKTSVRGLKLQLPLWVLFQAHQKGSVQ